MTLARQMVTGHRSSRSGSSPQARSAGLTQCHGDSWSDLVRSIVAELESSPGEFVEDLAKGSARAYLVIEREPSRSHHRFAEPPALRRGRSRHVNRAIVAMEADPAAITSMADLAQVTGASVRTLQAAFRQYTGTSPMEYLRRLRLARVHVDLLAADPLRHTVADIAVRHGFPHLGRFAAAYRAAYGCNPSATLRLPARPPQRSAADARPPDAAGKRLVIPLRRT